MSWRKLGGARTGSEVIRVNLKFRNKYVNLSHIEAGPLHLQGLQGRGKDKPTIQAEAAGVVHEGTDDQDVELVPVPPLHLVRNVAPPGSTSRVPSSTASARATNGLKRSLDPINYRSRPCPSNDRPHPNDLRNFSTRCRKDIYNKNIMKYYVIYKENDESLSEDEERMEQRDEEAGPPLQTGPPQWTRKCVASGW